MPRHRQPPPPGMSTSAPAHVEPSPVAFATPLSHDEERIDACYDGTTVSPCGTVRWRTFSATNQCRDSCHMTWRRSCTLHATTAQLHLACDDVPR
jgi:hypothetical protein